jgi:hypothetical protein
MKEVCPRYVVNVKVVEFLQEKSTEPLIYYSAFLR